MKWIADERIGVLAVGESKAVANACTVWDDLFNRLVYGLVRPGNKREAHKSRRNRVDAFAN
jgi:hypothetical protein